MKGRFTKAFIVALAVVAVSAFSVLATGTLSGTVIRNTATLTYKDVNNNEKDPVSDWVETTVTTLRGVDVSPATYSSPAGNEQKVLLIPFTITNTGNATDTIALTATGLSGWTYEIFADANGDGTPDDLTLVTTTGALVQTAAGPDPFYKVVVRVTAPATANFIGSDTVTLTATSSDGQTKDTGVMNVTVVSAIVDITKVASTTIPVPLVNFTYTLTVTNTGNAPAYNVSLTDPLDADLVHVSSVASFGTAEYNAGTVTWNIGTLAAGATATLTITVHVAEEVPQGTSITNTATLSYADANLNVYTDPVTSDPGTTQELADVSIDATYSSPSNVDPGDTIYIPFTVTNEGNGSDSFNLAAADGSWLLTDGTSTPIDWTFMAWVDTDMDGIVDPTELIALTTSDNTGDLTMGNSINLVAVTTVPSNAHMDASSSVTITATSTSNSQVFATTPTIVNNVIAPVLTLTKDVDKPSAQPGETLTYTLTIKNIGDGFATSVTLTDVLPSQTTYVTGTLSVVSTPVVINTPGYNSGTVTVTILEIPAGATVTITFQVTIN